MTKISAYIIAYNEEEKITDCINSVLWADEIIVADSGSEDNTADIATSLGATVVQIPFEGFGKLRNDAIDHCQGEWIFSLDSDERCTAEARDEILDIIERNDPSHDVYFVPRRNFFLGRWIKHSGWYPDYRQPQLFKKGSMQYTLDPVHEGYINQTQKPIATLKQPIWQVPFKDLSQALYKMDRYSTLGVSKLEARHIKGGFLRALGHATWSFIRHYFIKAGVLDGWPGFIIALTNFEGTFYRYAKLHEKQAQWQPPSVTPLKKPDHSE